MNELDRLFDVVNRGFTRTDSQLVSLDSHLRELNSRVEKHETSIALLQNRPAHTRTRESDAITARQIGKTLAIITAIGGVVESMHQLVAYAVQLVSKSH